MSLQPGKRTISSQRVKRRIYECAIMLFQQHGYEKVSVEDIAKASKTSIGSFYHYFKSKDELPILFLQTYLQSAFDEYEKRKLPLFHKSNIPHIQQLIDFLLFALRLPHEGGEEFLRMAMQYLLREFKSEISYNYMFNPERPYARICKKLILEGQESGEFRNDQSADELFIRISIFSNGIDQQCYLQHETIDVLEGYGAFLVDFTRSILLSKQNE